MLLLVLEVVQETEPHGHCQWERRGRWEAGLHSCDYNPDNAGRDKDGLLSEEEWSRRSESKPEKKKK